MDIQTDLDALVDGQRVELHPLKNNPLHKKPVIATYQDGYFYCDGSDPLNGPDYYFGDVFRHNKGWKFILN